MERGRVSDFEFDAAPHEYVPPLAEAPEADGVPDPGFDIVRDLDVVERRPWPERATPDPPGRGGTAQEASPHVLRFVPLDEFAAVNEPSAEALLGDDENTILPAGGTLMFYGDGGAGKTTLEVDLVLHLATGRSWLGIDVPRPVKVAVIENEGPRGKFRDKLERKLAGWAGADVGDRCHVLEDPWARLSFAEESHRAALAGAIGDGGFEVVVANPLSRLGTQGGGTLDEVGAFMAYLELVRAELERPVAFWLVHHENKAGDVSGAWEGVVDTLAHVQAQGNGATRVFWQKVRWGSTLHGKTWKLLWRDGESFELDETPERTDEDIADEILQGVREHPGASWNHVEKEVTGKAKHVRSVRDALLEEGLLVNVGTGKTFKLYRSDDPAIPEVRPERDAPGTHPASGTGTAGESASASLRPPLRGRSRDGRTSEVPDDQPGEDDLAWR